VDPQFLAVGDPTLDPGSPMIDAGDGSAPELPEFDIFGITRAPNAPVDIGAYEYVKALIFGKSNSNFPNCFISTISGSADFFIIPFAFLVITGILLVAVKKRRRS